MLMGKPPSVMIQLRKGVDGRQAGSRRVLGWDGAEWSQRAQPPGVGTGSSQACALSCSPAPPRCVPRSRLTG